MLFYRLLSQLIKLFIDVPMSKRKLKRRRNMTDSITMGSLKCWPVKLERQYRALNISTPGAFLTLNFKLVYRQNSRQ